MSALPPDKPAFGAFPELARAIRSQSDRILDEWRGRTLVWLPELGSLSVKEFHNDIARILAAVADALESANTPDLRRLLQTAPSHGFQRFMQEYDLADLFAEERVLRRVVVDRVEEALGRRCEKDEAASLHTMFDLTLQQGVLALVESQKEDLRRAGEVRLKHLSFLSHDMSNNFFVITTNLEVCEQQLERLPEMQETAETVRTALAVMRRTRDGMRTLLEHEQLSHTQTRPRVNSVRLRDVIDPIVALAASGARAPAIDVHIDPEATAHTNGDLLAIILQNLIGNAVKHAGSGADGHGTVRVAAEPAVERGRESWIVSVTDNGPGIPPDKLDELFEAFTRLPPRGAAAHGDGDGFGLGLAIAAQAARLLGEKIRVQSQPDQGSRFELRIDR